jgi:phosphoribosylglycinamide formyltransferase-1
MSIRIAVFASGRGSNLASLLKSIDTGRLSGGRIVLVISNNSGAGALELARGMGIEAVHISGKTHPDPASYEQALLELLHSRRIELILLAGYMKLLPASLVTAFQRRILNIHPALLPRHGGRGMYGLAVHRSVIESGERESGVTIHYVNERYDEGDILRQQAVPVLPGDDPEKLAARILEVEHDLYWRAVKEVIESWRDERRSPQ